MSYRDGATLCLMVGHDRVALGITRRRDGGAVWQRGGVRAARRQTSQELQVHCYRMMGGLSESEDMVQECLLRAWRSRASFEGRSTLRARLYRIATNACLDELRKRPRRVLPYDAAPAADLTAELPAPTVVASIEPYADSLWEPLAPRTSAGVAFP